MLDLQFKSPNYEPINPQSVCIICSGVPFDSEYRNTIKYANRDAQYDGIVKYEKYRAEQISPVSLQSVRVGYCADVLYDCNYLIIQNRNFSSRILYAFIDRIEYINPNTCEIFFTLDIMQTYLFDIEIMECLVEREHVEDDTIGAHILDEGFAVTDYTTIHQKRAHVNDEMGIRIITTADPQNAGMRDNIFTALRPSIFKTESVGAAIDMLMQYYETPDNVVSIQMIPTVFLTERESGGFDEGNSKTVTVTIQKPTGPLNGYTPRNNKLYTYPYCFLYADNSQEQGEIFKLEDWNGGSAVFQLRCASWTGNPTVTCAPAGGYNGWIPTDISQYLTMSGYPMCAWASDTYKVWAAQNALNLQKNIADTLSQGVVNAAMQNSTAGLAKGAAGVLSSLSNTAVNQYYGMQTAKLMPDKVHGQEGSNTMLSYQQMDFYFTIRCLKMEQLRSIDEYLTMFGYRVDRVKKPNLESRTRFNFVKTKNSIVQGRLPWDVRKAVMMILDRGITFWHGDFIGDYTTPNTIR